ncbi:hypothetical protein CYMTET_40473 [Cymbomonas tetramitiformis]|uniref:SWIM-type domain-containing protein n=1 Tax=Cymbomonas tetramitiformis TaxID=36881 RepID=A0AAE0C7Z3_9CHLO|nr:hypothetical protein CYMTET_40473 [Cymbomonas tetramitiformis]
MRLSSGIPSRHVIRCVPPTTAEEADARWEDASDWLDKTRAYVTFSNKEVNAAEGGVLNQAAWEEILSTVVELRGEESREEASAELNAARARVMLAAMENNHNRQLLILQRMGSLGRELQAFKKNTLFPFLSRALAGEGRSQEGPELLDIDDERDTFRVRGQRLSLLYEKGAIAQTAIREALMTELRDASSWGGEELQDVDKKHVQAWLDTKLPAWKQELKNAEEEERGNMAREKMRLSQQQQWLDVRATLLDVVRNKLGMKDIIGEEEALPVYCDSASEENEEEDADWEEAEEAEEAEEEEAEESCAKSKPQDKFATVLREFSTKEECKDYVQSHEFKWVFARTVNAYMNSGQTGGVYHCDSHVECRACLRYRGPRKGEEKWFVKSNGLQHTSTKVTSSIEAPDIGVPHDFKQKVKAYIEAGDIPSRILNKLTLQFRGQPSILARLPSLKQIGNMKREFTRKATGGIKFETVADLVEHTKGLELKPTYPPDADVNAVVVLPNGVFEFGDNFGFCFSTRNILQNAERAQDAWGGSFPGETDGSWKFLYCGWPILAFGAHSIYYDADKCAIRHKFRPISFMFTKGESEQAFTRLFECTIEAIQLLFTFRIELSTAASDKADAIKTAFARVWPNAKWVTCWPHISMKPRKEWMKLMVAEDKQPVLAALKEYLARLHKTRSREQFQQLAKLAGYQLRSKKEEQVANILDKEYTSPPYDAWYVTASGVVYCSPSSQPIEAYWKTVKSTKLYQLRARLDNMMHEGIKNWLYLDATTGLCEPISSDNGGVVPAEVIASAYDKLAPNAYNKVAGVYYVNTKEAIDEPVTATRVEDYNSSLAGNVRVRVQLSIDTFVQKYMSLHKVVWCAITERWVCDCKGFWHGGVCSHSHVAMHLENLVDLKTLNAKLPAREKSGRKSKTKGAWHKQGPSPAKKAKKSSKSSSQLSKLAKQAKEIKHQLKMKLKTQQRKKTRK